MQSKLRSRQKSTAVITVLSLCSLENHANHLIGACSHESSAWYGHDPGHDHLLGYAPADGVDTLGSADTHDGAGHHMGGADRQVQHGGGEDDDGGVQISSEA